MAARKRTPSTPHMGQQTFTAPDLAYNLDEWIVPANAKNRETERLNVRVSPQIQEAILAWIQSGTVPYKTTSELIRHAIARHLEFLARVIPDGPTHNLVHLRAAAIKLGHHRTELETEQLITGMDETVRKYQDEGEHSAAAILISQIQSLINSMHETPIKARLSRTILNRYETYMTAEGLESLRRKRDDAGYTSTNNPSSIHNPNRKGQVH